MGTGSHQRSIHFTGGNDGAFPQCVLAWGTDSNLYGTADAGGSNFSGTVFKIGTNGAFTSLYSFTGGDDGSSPHGGLTLGSNGAFYGTTQFGGTSNAGAIFKFTIDGTLTNLYALTGGDDGTTPIAGLTLGSDGNFYGAASSGGTNDQGTVFRITPGKGRSPTCIPSPAVTTAAILKARLHPGE